MEEMEVEMIDETKTKVKLRKLSKGEMARIRAITMPAKLKSGITEYEVDSAKQEQQNDEMVKTAIVEPASIKASLDKVTEMDYQRLLRKVLKMNILSEEEQKNL